MILSNKRITKVMIRLHECADWSAPVLFANPLRQVFCVEAHIIYSYYEGWSVYFCSPVPNCMFFSIMGKALNILAECSYIRYVIL